MKKLPLLSAILLAISSNAFAADSKLKTVEQKASYTLGTDLAKNFQQQGIDIDADALILGFEDAMKKRPLKLTKEEMNASIQALKKQIMAKKMAELETKAQTNLKKGEAFLAENKKKPGVKTLPSGLQYRVIQEGKGPHPTDDDYITAHYEGKLIEGTVFDSSYKRGSPIVFQLSNVIPGWQEALKLMRPGAKWEIFVPAKLAYGKKGAGKVIGPNETLIFTVELIKVDKEKPANG